MPISTSDFTASISPNPISVVIGMTSNINLSFSNTSLIERGYNLTTVLTLPDGVSYSGGLIPPTSIVDGPGGTLILTWINIKDLAPNEIGYILGVTLKADEYFRVSGLPVPFDIPLVSVDLEGTVDTLPRGNDDPGNVKITKNDSANFIPLRYSLTKSAPGKIPKGAGLLIPPTSPLWPYQYTLTIMNNSLLPSTVTLIDNLPNGVRYLGGLSVVGPDSVTLSTPTVTIPSIGPGCQNFVTIDWGSVLLSPSSENIIVFNAAVWDNYTVGCVENSGSKIPHMAALQNVSTLNGLSGPVQGIATTNAMDTTIDKSASPSPVTDVAVTNNYTLTYRINQYDNVENVIITDTISDGQTYNVGSASLIPVNPNPPRNIDGTTTLSWNLGTLTTGTTGSITFDTTTSTNYFSGEPVVAADGLSNDVIINGINQTTLTPTPDSSSASLEIIVSSIVKELIGYFYKDGSPKTINVAAPYDRVEFKITYSAVGITAEQRDIEIDEYAPPNMGPLTALLPVTYGGTLGTGPFPLVTVAPNGLRWTLGTVPGNTLWTADFTIPVQNIDFVGTSNNLAKLAGINTDGFAYSRRDQVEVDFGHPNITFAKTVAGPDVNAIKAGETYTYSITISNPQNLEGNVTDAFEMDLTDIIPTGLTYTGTSSVTGTGTFTTPVFVGQNVSMTILKLAPDESLTLNYDVLITPLVASGQSYINSAELPRPYSQPDRSYQFPGLPFTDSTTLKALGVTMTKLVSPPSAKIGDSVTYLLQVTVPLGTTAYNVQVVDTFPIATQTYLGNATVDGNPVLPLVALGTVTFPTIPSVDATAAAVTILYAFDVRVVNGTQVPPYIENQTDNATVNWDLDNIGTPAVPFSTSAILQVRTPNLVGTKQQRNATTGGTFTSGNVNYSIGDIIEYRITLNNTGAEAAYNSVLTDILNPLLSFVPGFITIPVGTTASFAPNTVTWNIPLLLAGNNTTILFGVTTLAGIGSDGRITDTASFIYTTNDNGFEVSYGPTNTNTVTLIAPTVTISKIASITQGEIGDDITYTITYTVPNGTIAYSPIITDTLPVGQTYIGPATRQDTAGPIVPVVPGVVGQIITFPTDPDINANAGTRTLVYTFVARITSATHNPPFQETQTNTTNINWGRTPVGNRVNRASSVSITARTPNIIILKEQRNVTTGGSYTTSNISGIPTDVIYYRFTINSNGASPAFNINLSDILSSKISFISAISGPTVGIITPPPPGPGGTLTWNIPQLNNGSSAVYEFQIAINSGTGAGDNIPDIATSTYDSNDVNPITYNQNSNQVVIDIPLINFAKTSPTSVAAIGSTINYTLTVTIPNGVAVNNLSFTDVIPAGQNYVPGTFAGIPPALGVLIPTPNQLIYTDNLPSRVGPLVLIYTFDTIVISGVTVPPYTQNQRNIADVTWDITPLGPSATVSDFHDVEIRTPFIVALKEQRNVTTGGSFTTAPLLGVATTDIVEYRITLTNNGAGAAYNVVTTDILDPALTYSGLTSVSAGIVTPPPPNVNWTINPGLIIPGGSEALVFQVQANAGYAPGTQVIDQTSTLYDTLDVNPTTLGPVLSNQVAFNFNNLEIAKTVDKNALFIGDTVNYTVAVTIPFGNIAYNIQLTDTFPPEQTYNDPSLKVDGVDTIPLSVSPLVTPFIVEIDATLAAVTVIYTFSATVNSIAAGPQQAQIDTATVSWTLDPGGLIPGTPQSSNATVFVTDSDISLLKTQSNDIGGPFVQTNISTSVGSIIYYKLSVTNPGPNTIFNVVVTDNFSPLLQINSVTHSVGASMVALNTLTWDIASIPVLTTYDIIIEVLVLPGGGSGSTIPNFFTAIFDAVAPPPEIQYGPRTSNTVLADLPSTQFSKSVSKSVVELGEVITYTLSVIVPSGTIAYNVIVSDTLPAGQNYADNASIGGNPVVPVQVGQLITFPSQTTIDATAGEVTLNFTFDARVVMGNDLPPYTQIQTDNANMTYEVNPQGDPGTPLSDTLDITVKSPSLDVVKTQSHVTVGSGLGLDPFIVNVGDVVRYQLEATSSGASPAYNVVITDVLGPFEEFVGIVLVPAGIATYNALTRTVTWTIDTIPPGTIYAMQFNIQVLPGVGAGGSNTDVANFIYNSNTTTPIVIGPTDTNEVIQTYPGIDIAKTSNINNTVVGNVLTYTVMLTVPNGTIAYNVQLSDIIPVGQQYNNNATLDGVPIIPDSVIGQLITFPLIPFSDATSGAIVYIYTFETLVVSANVDPITLIDIQTNTSTVNWFIDPQTPAEPESAMAEVNVTDSIIEITKLQRNVTTGGSFTASNIIANIGDVIEYSLTVTNTGLNTVYNINITDILPIELTFISQVSVPIGTLVHSGAVLGGFVTWSFSPLAPGETVTAVFSVSIAAPILPTVDNFSSGDFTLTPDSTIPFKTTDSNIVTIDVLLITIVKTANPSVAAIGSIINYTLTVNIPSGVTAYNLTFTDVIPAGQNYVPLSFGGTPTPLGVLSATPNQLIYTDSEGSRVGPLTLIYTFSTTVITGTTVPPYTEVQRNIADLQWGITPIGPLGTASTFADVTINSPHINALKQQRLLPSGIFTTAPLLGIATTDVVEYRITLTNVGAADAYNVVTTDVLDATLTYLGLTSVSAGVVTPPPPGPGGTVNWTINPGPIVQGGSEILVFQVTVNAGYAPGTQVIDQSSTLFDTLDTNPTTLGPSLSNHVAFNFNNPEILKTVDKNAVFIGDIVNYTVEVTIPFGNIAYNVQLTDVFPVEQTYFDPSLKVDGVDTIPLSTSPLVTPLIPIIDATLAAVTVIYTFSATVNSIASGPQQAQIDTATVSWTLDPGGLDPGTPQSSEVTVYVTDSDITVVKTQSNDLGGPFVQTEIPTSVGNLIYYKLSVANPGTNTIFNVVVTDIFNPLLQIISVTHSVGATLVTFNTLTWEIASIPSLTTYEAIVEVLVLPGGGSQSKIPNFFTAVFDAVAPPPEIEYGPRTSNTVLADLPSLQFNKTVSSGNVELGEIITYTLAVTVPNGTLAYNVLVSDILPIGQEYNDNATLNGVPIIPDSIIGQIITFPVIPFADATMGAVNFIYTFEAQIISANVDPVTLIDQQINESTVTWFIDPQTPAVPVSSTAVVNITDSLIRITKLQRNVSSSGSITDMPIIATIGDVIEYSLTVTNMGTNTVYNLNITDLLSNDLAFISPISVPIGTLIHSGSPFGGLVTWSFSPLAPGNSLTAVFSVTVVNKTSLTINNFSSGDFTLTPTGTINFKIIDSNVVTVNFTPYIQLKGCITAIVFAKCNNEPYCPCQYSNDKN
ncbi:beta strand repeat-containing protein [Clostridium sp.]|uniref:beta strand repeat-containing protein n=1 Tax=Clostridium sp. TaxID=1506 RepID=UPI003D6CD1F3